MRSTHILISLLLLASCELVTQIDIPEEPRKAVINSVMTPDSTWWIAISTSIPMKTNINLRIQNPLVTLTDGNGQLIPLTMDDSGFDPHMQGLSRAIIYTSTSRPAVGMTYHILVKGTNVLSATATAQTPTRVELLNARLDSANMITGNNDFTSWVAMPIEFTFDDPAGQGDFYYPTLTAYYSYLPDPVTGDITSSAPQRNFQLLESPPTRAVFGSGREIGALSDKDFDGERHTVNAYAMMWNLGRANERVDSVHLYLSHVGEEYHRYFQTTDLYIRTRSNPFAEPVQIYTNVEGGLGIFAGVTPSYWDFRE